MEISAISTSGAQSNVSYQNEIKALENKKQRLQEQITKINQENGGDTDEKQKQIQTLQAQIQMIDTQIQQLQKKQTQAKSEGSQTDTAQTSNQSQLVRNGIDIEA